MDEDTITGVRQFFQPIVDLSGFEVKHHEVLLRPIDDSSPMDIQRFVEDFESRGDIHILDQWTLRTLHNHHLSGRIPSGHSLAVNISGHSVENPAFQRWFSSFCRASENDLNLIIEITETSPLTDFSIVQKFCDCAKASGFEIAIDDFGSGYAGPEYLQNIPADYLKIDGTIVRDLKDLATWKSIQHTVSICRSRNIQVIAEQIEGASQMKQARLLGCKYGQGYFFGRPDKMLQDREQVLSNMQFSEPSESTKESPEARLLIS